MKIKDPYHPAPKIEVCAVTPALHPAWQFYATMYRIRCVERTLLDSYSRGLLFGTVHTCIGQEVSAAGVIDALDRRRDVVWSNHRGHGHYLAYTGDVQGLISEVFGKAGGVCGGVGGSQHLQRGNFYSNGILGGTLACATGCAFAEKYKRSGAITVVFFGDGALGEGIVYESFNIASLWQLPILFVLEDNGYAQSTPKRLEQSGDVRTRSASFAINATSLPADDVVAVSRTAALIVEEIRRDSRPHFLTLETYRLAPHSKGDDTRNADELAALKERDPLVRLRKELYLAEPTRLAQLEDGIAAEVSRCIEAAMADVPLQEGLLGPDAEPW